MNSGTNPVPRQNAQSDKHAGDLAPLARRPRIGERDPMATASARPHPHATHGPLDGHRRRVVAVHAGCDPRAVTRYLRGDPQHATTTARIEAALRELGHVELVRGR